MLTKPDRELSHRIKSLVDSTGLSPVAHFLGLADATVARLAAGITVSQGTVSVARTKLQEADNALAK